jgi:protein TonB
MTDIRTDTEADVQFLFPHSQKRVGGALSVSLVIHGVVIAMAIFLATRPYLRSAATSFLPDSLSKQIVWLPVSGPGGGGGGGGNRSADPRRRAELAGNEKDTVPVAKPPSDSTTVDEPQSVQNLMIPAVTSAADNLTLPGVLDASMSASESQGSGTNGGGGTGNGHGSGPGSGDGLGPGLNTGVGDGPYHPGNGVGTPRVLKEVKPQYTAQAMRAKIQGTVLLECVVLPDGTAGNVKVIRSLDSSFGLAQEAIKAARQWQFAPGTKQGQPVAVLVTIEIAFTLR